MSNVLFIERKDLREEVIDRVDVLEKVKELILLPNTDFATTSQVAEYYGVDTSVIRQIKVRNNDELESDGVVNYSNKEIKELLNSDTMSLLKIPPRGTLLFPKRAILRVGMLLRDSEVAKEIRTRLLDIVHDTKEESPEIVQNIVQEMDEEKQLMLERVNAEMNGDYGMVSVINAKLFALKNKRIAELEPKADYHDTVLNSEYLKTTTDIAKDLSMSARKLNQLLHEEGIIYPKKVNGKTKGWYLYSEYDHFVPEYADYKINQYGQQLKWTEKGRKFIIDLVNKLEQSA